MTNKTVAERLREAVKTRKSCDADIIGNALGRAVVCGKAESCFECEAEWFNALADMIEAEQAERQLPEGIEWPRFEDGELVKPFDKLPGFDSEGVQKFIWTSSNNGAWQLQDAEGHMLNVMHGEHVKRPEPDTFKSILSEMVSAIECEDCVDLDPYIERYRKLMGGE